MDRDLLLRKEITQYLDNALPKIRTAVRLRIIYGRLRDKGPNQLGEQAYNDFRKFLEHELFAARKKV